MGSHARLLTRPRRFIERAALWGRRRGCRRCQTVPPFVAFRGRAPDSLDEIHGMAIGRGSKLQVHHRRRTPLNRHPKNPIVLLEERATLPHWRSGRRSTISSCSLWGSILPIVGCDACVALLPRIPKGQQLGGHALAAWRLAHYQPVFGLR